MIIATRSRARIELLKSIGLEFEAIGLDVEEVLLDDPVETIRINTGRKMDRLIELYGLKDKVLATFDTVIWIDGRVIGKPSDRGEAYRILRMLSGRPHEVYTGVRVSTSSKSLFEYEVSKVYVDSLDDELIEWYLSKGEYIDAAGGYRIQGYAKIFIRGIEGCYFNIVGPPINRFIRMLRMVGYGPKIFR